MKFWQSVLCVVLASVLRNSALAQSTVAQEEGALPQELPDAQALQGSFGNINASVAPSINLANSLKEGKPVPFAVRQAYIATQKDDASKITGGVQTVRSSARKLQLPCTVANDSLPSCATSNLVHLA